MSGVIPGYIDQVNTILRWWDNPCDAPWTVYAEAALEPAGELAIALMSFGLSDIARGLLRPKGLRSGRHSRRGSRSGRRRGGIPELGNLIGKNLPGAALLHGREVTDGVKKLWMLDGVIQRLLWHWMVADLTLEFFADWLGAVQTSEFCAKQVVGAAAWEASPTIAAIQGWQAFEVAKLYERGGVHVSGSPAFHSSGFGWSEGQCSVTVAVDGAQSPGSSGDPHLEVRMRGLSGVTFQGAASPSKSVPGQQGLVMAPLRLKQPSEQVVEIRVVPSGFFTCKTAMAAAVQTIGDLG